MVKNGHTFKRSVIRKALQVEIIINVLIFKQMNKKEFKAKASQTIDEVPARINELKVKNESAQDDAKSQYEGAIKYLEAKKSDLETMYAELNKASEDKWEETKDAFSSAFYSFKEGLSKISSLFSKPDYRTSGIKLPVFLLLIHTK